MVKVKRKSSKPKQQKLIRKEAVKPRRSQRLREKAVGQSSISSEITEPSTNGNSEAARSIKIKQKIILRIFLKEKVSETCFEISHE